MSFFPYEKPSISSNSFKGVSAVTPTKAEIHHKLTKSEGQLPNQAALYEFYGAATSIPVCVIMRGKMNKINVLSQSLLFRKLALSELEKLAAIGHQYSYNAGDQLFQKGDPADELLIIALGSVKVGKELDGAGNEKGAITLGSYSYFGELAAVEGNEDRAVSAYAIEKTFVLGFKRSELAALCDSDKVLGYHIYRSMTRAFARRIQGALNDLACC